jgi:hypothetical protein
VANARNAAALLGFVGPVAEAFVADQRIITAIMGPYGSGKTTTCIRKILESVFWQQPGPDGVRRARWCVVRDTYQQLETNVLNSWFTWFPKTKDNWNGREMVHRLHFDVALLDGQPPQPIYLEVYFRAMGDNKAEDVLKGLELTGLWLNEVDTLDKGVLSYGLPRCGRYPSAKDGGCQWYGLIADFNAPDEDNWTYALLAEGQLPIDAKAEASLREKVGPRFGIGFHRQPGGRSVTPPPENIQNLDPNYYANMIIGLDENGIKRFVDNEFGAVRKGQPVYPEFNAITHVAADDLRADPDLPLIAGLDGGRTPALIFAQHDPVSDQLRLLREVVLYDPQKPRELRRLGANAFGEICAARCAEWFPDHEPGVLFYDPALDYGTEEDGDDFLADFQEAFPWRRVSPGGEPGNRIDPRLEAVRKRLTRLPGGKPALLFAPDPAVRVGRLAFKSGYVLERVAEGNGRTGRFRSIPEKNDYSHIGDAIAELCLGVQNRGRMIANLVNARDVRRAAMAGGNVEFGSGFFRPAA